VAEPRPDAALGRPPGGPVPPAPPATGEPGRGPDPRDPGPPIPVRLSEELLGDLGNGRVDARLLTAILLREGAVGEWLRSRGIDPEAVDDAFPGSGWPR
jgi:hypothetical protein